jgi:hypothetical protein
MNSPPDYRYPRAASGGTALWTRSPPDWPSALQWWSRSRANSSSGARWPARSNEYQIRYHVRVLAPSALEGHGCEDLPAAVSVGETAGAHRFHSKGHLRQIQSHRADPGLGLPTSGPGSTPAANVASTLPGTPSPSPHPGLPRCGVWPVGCRTTDLAMLAELDSQI